MDERVYTIALTLCEGIGHAGAKTLIESVGCASEVFALRKSLLDAMPDASKHVIDALDNPEAIERAKREIDFADQKGIRCITQNDAAYPARLKACPDSPSFLFFKGNTDLNKKHIVSIVGTRQCTDYGKTFCQQFVKELADTCPDVMIVSGLAYGIDIHAHRAALSNKLSTVGVLAHGLDRIYPSLHRKTAIEMLEQGGLLTEYLTGTEPLKGNFLCRNRIVAGISDATIVVESLYRGGSLSTANLAVDYNRNCFAVPGRRTDETSEGCNKLISQNKAMILTTVDDFLKEMGWAKARQSNTTTQRELFIDLNEEEKAIMNVLNKEIDPIHINKLSMLLNMPVFKLSSTLFELEMKGLVKALVGSNYKII